MNIFKAIINIIRHLDDFLFDNFGPIRILFIVRNSLSMASLLPLIKEAEKREGIKIAITRDAITFDFEKSYEWPKSGEIAELYRKYFVSPNRRIFHKWHYVFTTEFTSLWFRRNTTLVYTLHGSGYGNHDRQESESQKPYMMNLVTTGNHSLYFCNANGDYREMQSYLQASDICMSKQFFISGLARIDSLVNSPSNLRNVFLQGLNCDSSKKTIVVSSHWTPKSLFLSLGVNIVKAICGVGNNYNILVMGHCHLWSDKKSELYTSIKKLEGHYDNLRFLPYIVDTVGLLRSGDLFIGDNSSIFIEFCLMDKPILFFDNPDFTFSDEKVGALFKNASISFTDESEIVDQIEGVLFNPDTKQQQRKQVADHFLSRRGTATKYIIDIIEQLGRVSGPNSSAWDRVEKISKSEFIDISDKSGSVE
jgi:CDP-glycerol glycerophosphotransferase (TagB/SpsB family)